LYDRATRPSGNFHVTKVRARVSDVFHRDSPREAGIAFYDNTGFIRSATFSYAILACRTMPPPHWSIGSGILRRP
jgi:hypothetical protein